MKVLSRLSKTAGQDGSFLKAVATGFVLAAFAALAPPAVGGSFSFTTGAPDGKIGTASRPDSTGKIEIESADDFILSAETLINGGTFTGLLPAGYTVQDVRIEIYRVFPKDSSNPPDGRVPTRVNSPSDVAFDDRTASGGSLSFTTTPLNPNFTAANSVLNGIHPIPNQTTGGEGPVTGQEVQFNVSFTTAFDLSADHYFFIPQVQLSSGDFLWLSAPKPNVVDPFTPDLQSWIRNSYLDPDWLRIGTDIVGDSQGTYNAAFSLNGTTVPDTGYTLTLFGIAGLAMMCYRRFTGKSLASAP